MGILDAGSRSLDSRANCVGTILRSDCATVAAPTA